MIKKICVFLLSLTICFTPTLVFAGAAEKWEIVEKAYDASKKTVEVTAKKVTANAANDPNYKVRVPVSASDLGKTVKGMLWMGVASAAVGLLIDSVGWVIDDGSQIIKKPVLDPTSDPNQKPNTKYIYTIIVDGKPQYCAEGASDCVPILQSKFDIENPDSIRVTYCKEFPYPNLYATCFGQIKYYEGGEEKWSEGNLTDIYRTSNPDFDPSKPDPQPRFTPVSDSELGDLILGESTDPKAQPVPQPDIITDAYDVNNPASDTPAPTAVGDALDNANPEPASDPKGDSSKKPNQDTDGDGIPDTYNPELPDAGSEFSLPSFCDWAVSVCEFFKVQKQDNNDIKENQKEYIDQNKDFHDWVKEKPEDFDSDNEIEVEPEEEFDLSVFSKDRFSVSKQCPVPEQHTLNVSGISVNFSFDLSPICQVLEFARPALVACSYLYAAYIVIGAARNG